MTRRFASFAGALAAVTMLGLPACSSSDKDGGAASTAAAAAGTTTAGDTAAATTEANSGATTTESEAGAPTTDAETTATSDSGAAATTDSAASATTEADSTGEFVPISGVPGVSDKEIAYSVIGTRSNNPLGTCILDCYLAGIKAYFAFRNSTGGIYGRQLVVSEELDDELGNNQVRALEVISNGKSFGSFNAPILPLGWGDLNDAGIPTYVLGTNPSASAGLDANFPSLAVNCLDCTQRIWAYVAEVAGAHNVAAIGYGANETAKACTNNLAKTIIRYGDAIGAKLAYENDDLPFGLANGVGPEVTAMKQAGVDFIESCTDENGMKVIAEELKRQGMDDVVLFHPGSYDQKLMAEGGDLFEGDLVWPHFLPFEATTEGTQLSDFLTWMKDAGQDPTENAMNGWINADLAYQGLVAAGPTFDRASVIAATNGMTAWNAGGLIVPVDWSTGHLPKTTGESCDALVKVVGGKFESVAPPDKPWICWDQPEDTWSEPIFSAEPY